MKMMKNDEKDVELFVSLLSEAILSLLIKVFAEKKDLAREGSM